MIETLIISLSMIMWAEINSIKKELIYRNTLLEEQNEILKNK